MSVSYEIALAKDLDEAAVGRVVALAFGVPPHAPWDLPGARAYLERIPDEDVAWRAELSGVTGRVAVVFTGSTPTAEATIRRAAVALVEAFGGDAAIVMDFEVVRWRYRNGRVEASDDRWRAAVGQRLGS